MSMVPAMQASGAGVVVLSCADPRVFPDKILGLDDKLSKFPFSFYLLYFKDHGGCSTVDIVASRKTTKAN
jgi:hypothetical protein